MQAAERRISRWRRDAGSLLVLAGLAAVFLAWSLRAPIFHWLDATLGNRPLNGVRSWHYHLTGLDHGIINRSDADLIVTEYSSNVGEFRAWTPEEVARMKVRPDGRKRVVLAYFSIGEAESYRFYWRPEWKDADVPPWYVAENCAWPRNYMVRFWHDGWKDIIYRGNDSFLKRIVASGFDGVYLDRIDVFWELVKERPSAREDMIRFVTEIAETGRRLKPGFLIVAQNAEDLLVERLYRDIIDGLGKEDLLFGHNGTNTRNNPQEVAEALGQIRILQQDWKPVVAVEYVTQPELIAEAQAELRRHGLVPTSAHRALDGLPPHLERPASTIKFGTPEWIATECKGKRHW
ncbi:MAG: endo alpha-1,4 polygalactosaminidase [Hyphomicrobiaceae bacterium]|nr:endo alpha-1,4 polygalactosaminidase [Hyphomicrobiaceae bacterium]